MPSGRKRSPDAVRGPLSRPYHEAMQVSTYVGDAALTSANTRMKRSMIISVVRDFFDAFGDTIETAFDLFAQIPEPLFETRNYSLE